MHLPVENNLYSMNKSLFIAPLLCLLIACGNENAADATDPNAGDAAFYPVVSFLKSQAAHIDTSLYTIMQLQRNGNGTDTAFIPREAFKDVSNPFLTLPNIAEGSLKKKYNESRLYDETLDRFVITYTPKEVDEELEIRRQDVVIVPNLGSGENIESVYIERQQTGGDSTVHQKMNWETEKGFTIRSIIQKQGAPETVHTTEVVWRHPRSATKL